MSLASWHEKHESVDPSRLSFGRIVLVPFSDGVNVGSATCRHRFWAGHDFEESCYSCPSGCEAEPVAVSVQVPRISHHTSCYSPSLAEWLENWHAVAASLQDVSQSSWSWDLLTPSIALCLLHTQIRYPLTCALDQTESESLVDGLWAVQEGHGSAREGTALG